MPSSPYRISTHSSSGIHAAGRRSAPTRLHLSDRNGPRTMHVSGGASDASSSLLAAKVPSRIIRTTLRRSVHSTMRDSGHLDANQGCRILNFSGSTCKDSSSRGFDAGDGTAKVRAIHTEVSTRETYVGAALYPELKDLAGSPGLRCQNRSHSCRERHGKRTLCEQILHLNCYDGSSICTWLACRQLYECCHRFGTEVALCMAR